ncbi:MAG: NUDIX hydrolase [Oleiphilaceae bacterium]|nr:NUDIX hydrolase [Oleiphilaceae bacterium]
MTWKPHATVAVIAERNGRYLTVEEHSNGTVVFNQPAGHVERGESLFQAARRETLEETGYEVALTGFLGLYTLNVPEKDTTYHRFCFTGDIVRHRTDTLDEGIIAAHWLSLEELQARQPQLRSPLVMACIRDYRQGPVYPLNLVQEFSLD